MNFSGQTNSFIEKVNDHSQKPLKNIYEVSVIVENTFKQNSFDIFKDLIFTAKYVKGLKSVLSNQIVNKDDFMERMFEEFNKNVQKFSGDLKNIIDSSDDKVKLHFSKKYFELKHESLVDTMELVEDLSLCKEFLNVYPESINQLNDPGITS